MVKNKFTKLTHLKSCHSSEKLDLKRLKIIIVYNYELDYLYLVDTYSSYL